MKILLFFQKSSGGKFTKNLHILKSIADDMIHDSDVCFCVCIYSFYFSFHHESQVRDQQRSAAESN